MLHQYFDQALKRYRISGKQLSDVTGISTSHISDFRRGKTNPSCEILMSLLDGADQIEMGVKEYFCQLLSGRSFDNNIEEMDYQQLAQLLVAIADKLQSKRDSVQELISA
jgi:transcriptional regulator with XRE-family HTH domain